MKQLFFDFFANDCYNINNFIVNDSNRDAYNFLMEDTNHQIVFLSGEEKSGKTYLSTIWKQKYNAKNINFNDLNTLNFDEYIKKINSLIEMFDYYVIDELNENFDEEKLLYLLNLVINSSSFLLIITRFNITKKKVHLKDLSSRIKSSTTLTIKKFCKKTKNIFIIKLLNDKGYALGDDIINYLTKKLPNNYKDIYLLIENILNNKLTLKEIKKILKM